MALPTTAAEVANLQNSTFALNNNDIRYDNYLNQMKNRLENLRDTLRTQESDLFTAIGYPIGREGILKFQSKLNELNEDFAFRSMANLSDTEFEDIVAMASRGIDYSKPIKMHFENQKDASNFIAATSILQDTEMTAAEQLIRGLNKIKNIKVNSSKVQRGKFHYFKSGQGGLSKRVATIDIHPHGKKKHLTITMNENQILPAKILNKMEKEFGLFLNDKIDGREALISYFSSRISNRQLLQYIIEEIRNREGYKFYETSISVIKGFLGEVRTVAALKYLFGSEAAAPTGTIQRINAQGKQGGEIPIDIIFKDFGIQVKNYQVNQGNVSYPKNKVQIGTFITNHLRPEQGIQELLLNFFGSYSFNKPISEELAADQYTLEQYKTIYGRFEQITKSEGRLQLLFDKYVDNILNISHEFQANSDLFADRKLYFNTFFMFGTQLVPASDMVQAIIEELSVTRKDRTLIKTSYEIDTPTAKNVWAPPPPESNMIGNREEHLKYGIKTGVTIDIQSILNRAYQRIK